MADNTKYIKTLIAYSDKLFNFQQFNVSQENSPTIVTRINDFAISYCDFTFYPECRFNLVYEYVNSAKFDTLDLIDSANNKTVQKSYSKFFSVEIDGQGYYSEFDTYYSAYNYDDKIEGKSYKQLVASGESLYLFGSFINRASTNSWYLRITFNHYFDVNLFVFDSKYIRNDAVAYGKISDLDLECKNTMVNTVEAKNINNSQFETFMIDENYELFPYSYNQSDIHISVDKNLNFNGTSLLDNRFYEFHYF